MTDCRTVCKICYASSSHKPSPTLSSEAKVTYDTSVPSKRMCTVCRMEWAPIRVAKEPSGPLAGRWVRIRPRPRISPSTEFQMCKNAQGKLECPRGQDCSYAHSKSELAVWNEEREREPRPAPPITGPYSYQLCKHVQNFGSCPYGQRCTFAHSEEELREWFRSTSVQAAAGPVPGAGGGGGGGGFGIVGGPLYRCDICNLTCTSRKQLEDHFSGGKHKQQQQQMQQQQFQPPRLAYSVPHPPHGVQRDFCGVRKKPFLSTPVNGFKMCMHILSNRRCVYGDFCTFAHTNEELEVWNRPRGVALYHHQQPPAQVGMRFQRAAPLQAPPVQPVSASDNSVPIPSVMNHQKPNIFAAASGLDDFEEGMDEFAETHDFADDLRARIIEEHNRKQDIGGFEKSHSDACVEEITGQPLSLAWSQPDSLQWTFEVSTTAAKILHSVTLFDTLATDFNILGAWLVLYGGQQRPLPGTVSLQGSGLQLKQRIAPPDKVHIKISLKPRSGILGQLVVFDFGSFFLARGLMVHVFNEVERNLVVNMGGRKRFRPAKPDLYWEQHYTPFTMPGHEEDEVFDKALPEYPLPEQIEKLIETGKYNNVENRVTKENYKRRMHNLLYLEEYQQRVDMSRYDLYDIEITPENSYSTPLGGMQYAADGFYYVTVSVEEVLYEGGRSIRSNDLALLLPMNQQVIHECGIEGVGRDTVILKITEKAKQAATASRNRCSLRFVLSRTHMREMHYAVDHLDLNVVFPTPRSGDVNDPPFSSSLSKCVSELKNTKLYQTQQNAINSMLDPACRQIPSLVLGPFGCGKTRTLRDCIMLLSLLVEDTTILICTHSNSAANIYVQELHREYNKRGIERVSMLRIYYTRRRTSTIPEIVKLYCNMENGSLALPSIAELKQYKIVVVTLSTSRALSLMGLPKGHFSHIFIDEAAQALESETLIPLTLANENTKVVLAGDHMQMDPPCYSEIARRYNLHVSLLERLYDHEAYNQGVGQLCKTLLTENYRSHHHILALPSKLFYKDKLTCRAEFPNTGPKNIPALKFVGVDGQEGQDDDSPSYYNDHEGLKAVEQVKLLVMGGLNQDEICVLSYYQKQVSRIRQLLRNEKLRQVSVYRVDDVQGKEYRALILSTVRTCSTNEKNLEEDAGFLTNPKLFNTAVTRAKEWLIVCGEPITLCTVGSNRICWLELIKKAHYELGSFEYQNAAQFERCLETKLIARQILDKRSEPFFRKMKQMLNPPADSQPSPVATTTQEVPTTAAQNSQHLSFLQAPPHLRQQMMRSKVTELSHGSDQSTVNKITEELTKLSVQDQGALLARPELLTQRVHELETILARAGPTAALLSATSGPSPVVGQGTQLNSAMAPSQGGIYSTGTLGSQKALGAIAPDLPPFLTSIIDGLTNYMKWCDVHLQNPQNNRPGVKENLRKQRTNLEQQTKLVNEQIHMYRELLKIVRTSQTPVRPTVSPSTGIPSQGPPSGPVRMGPQQIPPQQIPQQQQLLQGAPGGMQQFMSRPPQPFASGLPPMSAAVHHQQQMAQQMQQQQQHIHVQQLQQQQQLHLQHQQHLQHQHLQQQMYQKQMVGMAPPMQAPHITNTVGMTPNITPGASNFGGPHVAPFQPGKALSEVPRHSAPPSGNICSGPQAHPPQGQQLNPGHTYPAGPAPQASQSRMPSHPHSSSAFAFGVSPYFPNAQPDEPLTQLSVQTNLGSKPMGKGLSPLAAAINDASSRSSPLPYPQDTTDVYLSDDEFNS